MIAQRLAPDLATFRRTKRAGMSTAGDVFTPFAKVLVKEDQESIVAQPATREIEPKGLNPRINCKKKRANGCNN